MAAILETARLLLREFTVDDAAFIIELVNSPGWIQFIGDRNIKTVEQARNYLEQGPIKSYRENGFGLFMVEVKEHGTPIGMCGILKRDSLEKPDIGFAFLPAFTGKGFAFEVANATILFAKEKLNLPVILAITNPDNTKSIKLLQKIGMTFIRMIKSLPDNKELMLFSN